MSTTLRVSWLGGTWSPEVKQPIETVDLGPAVNVRNLGETLVFEQSATRKILLVVPEGRLVSAVSLEEEN